LCNARYVKQIRKAKYSEARPELVFQASQFNVLIECADYVLIKCALIECNARYP